MKHNEKVLEMDTLAIRSAIKTTQEEIEEKIMREILDEDNHEKRYQLIQQLDLLSRALITMKERDKE